MKVQQTFLPSKTFQQQTKDVQPETLNLTAVPLPNGYPHAQVTENEATVYAGWYTTPYQYTTKP